MLSVLCSKLGFGDPITEEVDTIGQLVPFCSFFCPLCVEFTTAMLLLPPGRTNKFNASL